MPQHDVNRTGAATSAPPRALLRQAEGGADSGWQAQGRRAPGVESYRGLEAASHISWARRGEPAHLACRVPLGMSPRLLRWAALRRHASTPGADCCSAPLAAAAPSRAGGRAAASCSSAPAAGPATAGRLKGTIRLLASAPALQVVGVGWAAAGCAYMPTCLLLPCRPLLRAAKSAKSWTSKLTRPRDVLASVRRQCQKGAKRLQQGRPPAAAAAAAAAARARKQRPAELCHVRRARCLLPPPSGGGTPACALIASPAFGRMFRSNRPAALATHSI